MNIRNRIAMATIAGLALAAAVRAEDAPQLTVDQIIAKTNHVAYYQGADGRADVSMTITDEQGQTRARRFIILRRDEPAPADHAGGAENYDGDQQFYVYFRLPADVAKMVFMVHKHIAEGQQDDRWLYLPALDLVKRIASAEKRTSFVGSDFYYEDVSGRNLADDTHELVRTTEAYYVVKNTPKDADSVEFSYYEMFIHKTSFVPVQVTYYDKAGKAYRQYAATKVEDIKSEKTGQTHKTVTGSTMKDLRKNSQTTLEYSDVKYDIGIPADVFTERYLRTPPREWLK